jgi:hypothetical protein
VKLQPLLTEYLVEYGNLPLAETGRLFLKHHAASRSSTQTMLVAPTDTIAFTAAVPSHHELQQLANFIAERMQIPPEVAVQLLEEEQPLVMDEVNRAWPVLGSFLEQPNGTFTFVQDDVLGKYLPSLSLEETKHQHPPEKDEEPAADEAINLTAYEWTEPPRKDRWWIWAIIIFVVAVALILLRYYAAP